MRSTLVLTIILISSLTTISAQTCDCGKDFSFLTEAYQKDYSGMQDFIKIQTSLLPTEKYIERILNKRHL